MPVGEAQHIRFGPFEVDLHSRELFRDGIRLKLQPQPIQVLGILLQHPGELVTREELRKRLWPEDTFVDFEQGLNTAVKKLRVALFDETERPKYIEMLPKRGYRFIGEVLARMVARQQVRLCIR
jgi:DNA-binding winged helix-turn-helix (wHTH) protein